MSINKILSLLPGVDCGGLGGCGKVSCAACAEAMAQTGDPALCPALKQWQRQGILRCARH